MSQYRAPIRDFQELLKIFDLKTSSFDYALCVDIISQIGRVVEKEIQQTNYSAEKHGLKFDPEKAKVFVPSEYKTVYNLLKDQGVFLLPLSAESGGSGAPWLMTNMLSEVLCSGNIAVATCCTLTQGAIGVLESSANDHLKAQYLPKMACGDFSGTMCLTEPHCGTDLGLIKTKAQKKKDHYLLSGQKIWITFGEHDMTENIIHLVLGRVEGAPEGIKGISLFLVPKFLPNGDRNQVKCVGLEEKMGQHCSPTCVMKFDQAVGYLVGDIHKGMHGMFKMMNPARIGVGIQGLACSELAYQIAYEFAMSRRQSRSLVKSKQDLSEDADLIWVHPDVRRMLISVRASNFGLRMLIAQTSAWLDDGCDDLVGFITPIVKSFCTDIAIENIATCQQLMGGSGYVKDYNIEKIYRDARITTIYEGTNGIQALDLIGRKIAKDGGLVLRKWMHWVNDIAKNASKKDRAVLKKHLKGLEKMNEHLMKNVLDVEMMGFIAVDYLNYLGHLSVMAMYAKIGHSSNKYEKLSNFYTVYIMPRNKTHMERVLSGKGNVMDDWDGLL